MQLGRWLEFAGLFVGLPVLMAVAFPPDWVWPVLLSATLLAVILLARTPGFRWRELVEGPVDWHRAGAVAAVTAVAAGVLVWWLVPHQALMLPRHAPGLWLAIMVLYPILSALPQEVMFRTLFFRRYAGLFADPRHALAINAAVFALAHLLFWNWIALVMTFAGGAIFGRAYLDRGFPTAFVLHAVCGGILFTSGLGSFFYHGAVN